MHIGDKIKVRIELRVDRDMEYVHMKDMRASCMEPTNVISQYKYQDGLGYYETTKDVSTNFFFGYLNKGTYVFEYPMFVTHSGNFSNGITTIQCMYAPEFTAHSEGVRVQSEEINSFTQEASKTSLPVIEMILEDHSSDLFAKLFSAIYLCISI